MVKKDFGHLLKMIIYIYKKKKERLWCGGVLKYFNKMYGAHTQRNWWNKHSFVAILKKEKEKAFEFFVQVINQSKMSYK